MKRETSLAAYGPITPITGASVAYAQVSRPSGRAGERHSWRRFSNFARFDRGHQALVFETARLRVGDLMHPTCPVGGSNDLMDVQHTQFWIFDRALFKYKQYFGN